MWHQLGVCQGWICHFRWYFCSGILGKQSIYTGEFGHCYQQKPTKPSLSKLHRRLKLFIILCFYCLDSTPMEATQQKKGFFKGKLAKSFSRFTKARTTSSGSNSSSKVVPCSTPSSMYSPIPRVSTYSYASSKQPTSFHEQKNLADLPSSMQKVSYSSFKPHDHIGYATETWGHADENVDLKASCYISDVRKRFQLDRV